MAVAGKGAVGDLNIGNFLKIFSTKGVYSNLSEASEMWKFMEKKRVAKPEGREVRYSLRTARGQTASQFLSPNEDGGSFPLAQRTTQVEAKAYFKDFATTIDVPRQLLNKTGSDLAQYADPLAEELNEKGIATARMLSRAVCADGSGILGVVASASVVSGNVVVVLNATSAAAGRSAVGNFQYGEIHQYVDPVSLATTAAIPTNTSTGSTATKFLKVVDINSATDTVVFKCLDSSYGDINDITATTIAAGDLIFPLYSGDLGDLPAISFGSTGLDVTAVDYGTMSYNWPGLETLTANDSRLVHGLTMEGAISGSRLDAGGDTIDRTHFQSAISEAKRRVGKNRYKWDEALMYDDTYDALMESWETDRVIVSQKDNERGTSSLGYTHAKDHIAFTPDEFVPKQRIYMCPSSDVLEFRGTSIDQVELNPGQKFYMPNDSSGNHQRLVRSYLEGSGLFFCKHPASIAVISNFVV